MHPYFWFLCLLGLSNVHDDGNAHTLHLRFIFNSCIHSRSACILPFTTAYDLCHFHFSAAHAHICHAKSTPLPLDIRAQDLYYAFGSVAIILLFNFYVNQMSSHVAHSLSLTSYNLPFTTSASLFRFSYNSPSGPPSSVTTKHAYNLPFALPLLWYSWQISTSTRMSHKLY